MPKQREWKVRRKPSRLELEKSIRQSGFPFQYQVVAAVQELGWEVSPSHCVYDGAKEASCEVDLVAMLRRKFETVNGAVNVNLNLAIECKDTAIPFVSFGLKHVAREMPGFVDEDAKYVHLTSTRDKGPNFFRLCCLEGDLPPQVDVKSVHHQLNRKERFYTLASTEWAKDKYWKLHVTQSIADMLGKFAIMAHQFDFQWESFHDKPTLEDMVGGPTLGVQFFMIVHSGKQYEWLSGSNALVESNHTPVMVNFGMPKGQIAYMLDIVPFEHLKSALKLVETSFDAIARQVVPSVLAHPPMRLARKGTSIPDRIEDGPL